MLAFLSHLSGDEGTEGKAYRSPVFLSHLSGDEDEPEKNGRKVVGYKFLILDKPKAKPPIKDAKKIASGDNPDLSTINGLSDAQLSRITRSPKFIRDFSDLISPTSSINKDMNAWSVEFVKRIKENHEQFNIKRPIRTYLDY